MILPDVNLLIYAINRNSPFHDQARKWWDAAVSGGTVALCWPAVVGFLRLATNRRVVINPLPVEKATGIVDTWLRRPDVHLLVPTSAHWGILARLLRATQVGGNLATDAHIAAYAIEHGCTLCSNDADFGRFPGLRWRNPITTSRGR